jgi:virginiamycin B lyase
MRAGLISLGLLMATSLALAETKSVEIREWPVPWEMSRPRDPYAAEKRVWFVGQAGHYLASLDPATGAFEKVDLPDKPGPHNLVVGRDGIVWYAGNLRGYIGRYDPASGEIRRIAMPDEQARDPHTLAFDAKQEHLWFTVQGGNRIGRLRLADLQVDLISVPTPNARPYGIIVAADGAPWAVLFGTNKLASIDPRTLALTEHPLPRSEARPRRLDETRDGRIWYADYAQGYLGAFDPKTRAVEEWRLPSGADARPYAMAVDENDRVWVVETGPRPNLLVEFDAATEQVVRSTPIPSGAGTVRHMHYDAGSGRIWFGTDLHTVGYARVH